MDKKSILGILKKSSTTEDLQQFYSAYLSKKGLISAAFKELKNMDPEKRKKRGEELHDIKETIQQEFFVLQDKIIKKEIDTELLNDQFDWTYVAPERQMGHLHLLARERRIIENIFLSMGYSVQYGPEIVTKYENFESVNIPLTHPATEMQDNFYLQQKDEKGEHKVFRAHTSAYQVKLMRQVGAPMKTVIPGRVYRNENADATHNIAFWQIEGMLIAENVTIGNFKYDMSTFLQRYFGEQVDIRMRPAYFPFVEPGFEIDACRASDKKWIELLGAGMIHPNVLREGSIDPNQYSGFAFGVGINRLTAIKYGIDDIRIFENGDLRFVQSFEGIV